MRCSCGERLLGARAWPACRLFIVLPLGSHSVEPEWSLTHTDRPHLLSPSAARSAAVKGMHAHVIGGAGRVHDVQWEMVGSWPRNW